MGDQVAQLAVGRADDGQIDRGCAAAAQRHHGAFLQHTQQARLQCQRHVADLVEEQSAAVRLHDAAGVTLATRTGEGAFLVAEQLRLDQAVGDGGAVHSDEGLVATRPFVVNGACQQFLAGAGLALNQYRDVPPEHAANLFDDCIHLRIAGAEPGQSAVLGDLHPTDRLTGFRTLDVHADHTGRRTALIARLRATEQRAAAEQTQFEHVGAAQQRVVQRTQRLVEHRTEGVRQQLGVAAANQPTGAAVGGQYATILVEGEQRLEHGAYQLLLDMTVQQETVREGVREHLVLDGLHRQIDQRQAVMRRIARVAGDVKHAEHAAARVEDGRGRTGEEMVGREEVLRAVHRHWHLFHQRGTDGVGALAFLRPFDAGRQRDLGCAVEEGLVANRMDDETRGIGQHDHAARAGDLRVQAVHHRRRVLEQRLVALAFGQQQVAAGSFDFATVLVGVEAAADAAAPRCFDQCWQDACRHFAGAAHDFVCLFAARDVGGA